MDIAQIGSAIISRDAENPEDSHTNIVIRDAAPSDARAVANIWNHYIRDMVTFNLLKNLERMRNDITARQAQGHGFRGAK